MLDGLTNGPLAALVSDGDSDGDAPAGCDCQPVTDGPRGERTGDRLALDATACDGDGCLATEPDCRATAVRALRTNEVRTVVTRTAGVERVYDHPALLVAAARFADTVRAVDAGLSARATRDPIGAARIAAGRSGAASRAAAESGLLAASEAVEGYASALRPLVTPTMARAQVARIPPADARLADRYELDTGAVVRLYDRIAAPDTGGVSPGAPTDGRETDGRRQYHIEPPVVRFSGSGLAVLAAARQELAAGAEHAVAAVRAARSDAAADAPEGTVELATALERYTAGTGVLEHLFGDPAVSDVFATAPVATTPLGVRVGDEPMTTNVRLTEPGAASLAGQFRRASGRAFSRAEPTLDATTEIAGRRVRVAAVDGPVSDGHAFALRAHDREVRRLSDLVANGTLPPAAAGFLSVAVERGVACLVTGERGAGKTTLLGALLWALPPTARTVLVEDTPELPAAALREAGRDVQALRVASGPETGTTAGSDPITASEALRTALRLGESALVVGEVRGEEAKVLYEAMRVGAGGAAVLGTVHGEGGATVRDRVVDDLGVPQSAFAETDLVVTMSARETDRGRERRVTRIEEVRRNRPDDSGEGGGTPGAVCFAPLFERTGEGLVATDRLREDSTLMAELAPPGGSPSEVLSAVADRAAAFGGREARE